MGIGLQVCWLVVDWLLIRSIGSPFWGLRCSCPVPQAFCFKWLTCKDVRDGGPGWLEGGGVGVSPCGAWASEAADAIAVWEVCGEGDEGLGLALVALSRVPGERDTG